MNQSPVFNYIKPLLYLTLGCGLVYWFVFHPKTPHEWVGCVGYVAIAAHVLLFLYEYWGWRFNPFERIPRLESKYIGTLAYEWNGSSHTKTIDISIKQHRSSVSVSTKTDESESQSLASAIVKEEGSFSVYYVYRTSPFASVEIENPIQLGACRIVIPEQPFAWSRAWVLPQAPHVLSAKYWTSRKTCGDIRLQAIEADKTPLDPPSPSSDNPKP